MWDLGTIRRMNEQPDDNARARRFDELLQRLERVVEVAEKQVLRGDHDWDYPCNCKNPKKCPHKGKGFGV